MKNWTKSALVVAVGALAAHGVTAQVAGDSVRSRGVIVLRPTGTPTPAPSPIPVATPAPVKSAPGPAPVAKPAKVVGILPAPIIKACPRPFARPDLALADEASFDRKLKSRLSRRRPQVVVDLVRPYPIDGAPPVALAAWLEQVKSSGGQVSVEIYCQTSRGLLGNFFKRLFSSEPPTKLYAPAVNYDAVLQIDGLDQRVTQIAFNRRAGK